MKYIKYFIVLLLCVSITGCSQINSIKDKITGGGGESQDPPPLESDTNYSSTDYSSLKNSLGNETLKEIQKVVKKKNNDAFWDEFLYTVESQANNVLQTTDLTEQLNVSNISVRWDSSVQTLYAEMSGFEQYSLPQDSISLCYASVTGDKEYPYSINIEDISYVNDWFSPDKFWKFWEDSNSIDIATEYIDVIGDPYKAKVYSYKIAQKIFNAFKLLPEEYASADNLRLSKQNEKYYVDFYKDIDGSVVNFHIMQIQTDIDELINCLKDVNVESYFKVDEIQWEIDNKAYSMKIDDYKEVSANIRYNETMYLDTAMSNLSNAVSDEVLRGKIVDVLNFVREDVESHHRIIMSINKDYPKFQYLVLQNGNNMETTVFAVNESDIDPEKSVEEQYLCNGTKLFVIDSTGKYRNYLKNAQNALYYNYYKWTLPPENLGGDAEGNITDVVKPADVISGGDIID